MNLVDYVVKQHSKDKTQTLTKDELELAGKINFYFVESKPLYRQDVLDYFGITKHMFYKLQKADAIKIPENITNKRNSNIKRYAQNANT
jgi:hypothetical protein